MKSHLSGTLLQNDCFSYKKTKKVGVFKDRHTERVPCQHEGRGQSDMPTSQGTLKVDSNGSGIR
jgi:hypothetical protein